MPLETLFKSENMQVPIEIKMHTDEEGCTLAISIVYTKMLMTKLKTEALGRAEAVLLKMAEECQLAAAVLQGKGRE